MIIDVRQAIKDYFVFNIKEIREGKISYEMFQVIVFLGNLEKINQQEIANAIKKRKTSLTSLTDNFSKSRPSHTHGR